MKLNQNTLAQKQVEIALNNYHYNYNNMVYIIATTGKSVQYCNALIGEALAICGNPSYKLSNRNWGKKALEFLALFS